MTEKFAFTGDAFLQARFRNGSFCRLFRYIFYSMVNKINVFEREFMYVKIFHKCFIHFVIGTKENLQKAPRFEMDFVLNFVLCASDFTRF